MNTIRLEDKGSYVIIHLNLGRANPINKDLILELGQYMESAALDDSIKGVILTGQRNFFSVGLDLIELNGLDSNQLDEFWNLFLDFIRTLCEFPKPLVSAITGHSQAGGCLMAMSSDYRVMAEGDRFRIGLNEVPVGILLPYGFLALYAFWIGEGRAYQSVMEGKLFKPNEAVEVGLVNEVVPMEEVLECAERKMKHYLSLPQVTWIRSKQILRVPLLKRTFMSEDEKRRTMEHCHSDEFKFILQKLAGRLKPKKKA